MASTATARTAKPSDLPKQRGLKTALRAINANEPGPIPPSSVEMQVSPELAASWLLRNTGNRPVKQDAVDAWAREMTAGAWRLTNQGIGFDTNGVLIDGQNRLLAVVKSHTTQPFYVAVNLEPEAMTVVDTGVKRSVADVLAISGDALVPAGGSLTLISAAAKIGVLMQQGAINSRSMKLTSTEILAWISEHGEIAEFTRRASSMRRQSHTSPAILAYCMWRLAQVDEEAAAEFFDDWREMRTSGSGDPVSALIGRLMSAKDSRENLSRAMVISLVFRAWNARRSGKTLKRIPVSSRDGVIEIPEPK